MRFEPADEGKEDLEFISAVAGGVISKESLPTIHRGIEEEMTNGEVFDYSTRGAPATWNRHATARCRPPWRARSSPAPAAERCHSLPGEIGVRNRKGPRR
ncbi:hypothetical protein [Kushneria sinocarnis]|uniref:hypothetical protein n=1 Tax=Kushneria sinocarnis TaxID=595502 RepID=UPI003CCC865D